MKVEIWSDVVCPWCYIGKRRFEAALQEFPHREQVEVEWHSFELDPGAAARSAGDPVARLAAKYGMTREQAVAANARVVDAAAGEGLAYQLDRAQPGNTFDAHRLLHLAKTNGLGDAAKERLLAAYFMEGAPISDHEALVGLGAEVGLDPDEVRTLLAGDRFAAEVRQDEREAKELGISGVPFFVLDRRYGVSGAQPPELFAQALRQAWTEAHPPEVLNPTGADGCADGSCPI